jgi:ABC-type multidrug transport system fused ATPase/permease subunit
VYTGKSTVLKLITRMLDADNGEVLLDGVDIAHVTKDSVRRRVAVVPQDTCLFDDTVGYNIRYGSAGASDEEVREVVRLSNLRDTIAKLPQVSVVSPRCTACAVCAEVFHDLKWDFSLT